MRTAIQLFDVQCGMGSKSPGSRTTIRAADVLAELQRLRIAAALVRNMHESETADMPFDNANLYRWCKGHAKLVPCPLVIPNSGRDFAKEEKQVDDAIRRGAGAVWIRPGNDRWLSADWLADPLFNALQARRMPVLCLARLVTIEQVADLARRFPDLPLILAECDYRSQRIILPFLRAFKNVYLSLGNNYIVHRGIEQIVKEMGPEHLLFGTNFPETEAMTAVTYFMYSELTPAQKQLIGHGNFARLREDIVR